MIRNEPEFTLGVEEEYLLVDLETRALVVDPPKSLLSECEELLGGQVTTELLRSQIEVGTKVCQNIQEVREDLARLRACIYRGYRSARNCTDCVINTSVQSLVGSKTYGKRSLRVSNVRNAGRCTSYGDLRYACTCRH